ncbi:MAG: hypothetical protein KAW94_05505 [Candidatus Thorarchaeota archaeon]|nr:hypothetical protein [Candidatus Thorarchaeota archaeon]
MTTDLERALSKLRFDDQVLGYSLMTKDGRPFVSFSFPDELFPRVRDSISLYKSDLRLMTIDTEKGLVVLSPVDVNWILTVLYVPELQLGLAIAKTKNVLRLLEGIELPPPPDEFEESVEGNLQVLETMAINAASTSPMPSSNGLPAEEPKTVVAPPTVSTAPAPVIERSPEDFAVQSSTVPKRGGKYTAALTLDSELHGEMKKKYRNFGFDVLMLVDGAQNVERISDAMFQSTERVTELLMWAASMGIVDVPLETGTVKKKDATLGRFVKCPKYEGNPDKVKPEDKRIINACDGTQTTDAIAEFLGVAHAKVIQTVALYRKHGLKMIGKTV